MKKTQEFYDFWFAINNWQDCHGMALVRNRKNDPFPTSLFDWITIIGANRIDKNRAKLCKLTIHPTSMEYTYTNDEQTHINDRIGGFWIRKGVLDGSVSIPVQSFYSLYNRIDRFVDLSLNSFKVSRTQYAINSYSLNDELTPEEEFI